jgi:hypothetical protein
MRGLAVIAVALLLLVVQAASAGTGPELRSGDHPGFGRVVLALPPGTTAQPAQDGDRLTLRFSPAAPVAAVPRAPRNVRALNASPGVVELVLAPGTQLRRSRLGDRIVLDVLDPPSAVTSRPAPARQPHVSAPIRHGFPIDRHTEDVAAAPPPPPPPPQQPPPATPPQPPPAPQVVAVAEAQAEPMRLAASAAPLPEGIAGRAASLPFDPQVGAAAFRRGDTAVVVFDQRRPIDMAGLRDDPIFATAAIQLLPGATVLRLKLPATLALSLTRSPTAWTIAAIPEAAREIAHAIRPEPADGVLRLPADGPGQVVSVPDHGTGGVLLVGTQLRPGQSIAVTRRAPEFALLATWQGVAVEPVSDSLSMRVNPQGFAVDVGAGRALALSVPSADSLAAVDAQNLTRRFDFPAAGTETLLRRLQAATAAAASAPARARGPRRMEVAQAMLALGMGAEAQSTLALSVAEDGRLADDPGLIGLSAIAALLAGRPAEAAGMADPRLTGSDEIALWRAIRIAMTRQAAPDAAALFAADLKLLLAYPAPLRDRLLPLAAETMATGGELAAAQKLLAERADDHSLDLARAYALQQDARAKGADPKPALAALDRVAAGPDRLARARAATEAVELRLSSGEITPAQAADALEALVFAWRGGALELNLRQRVAELRARSGAFRPALAMLREAADIWPDQRPALQARLTATFAEALAQDASKPLPPLELVALAEENADLIPAGEAGQALAARLADRLTALDLPRRAVPLLEKLAAQAPAGPARAELGGRLAGLLATQGDASGALAALTRTASTGLPAPLAESRTLVFARAAAAAGDLPSATAALAALGTDPAAALRAELLEAAKDWPAAQAALRDLAARAIPAEGPLDEAQARILLRLASAAAQTGDEATLAALREHDTLRLPDGKLAEMFRVLTAGPVQGVGDLPRAARETKLARALPDALRTLTP